SRSRLDPSSASPASSSFTSSPMKPMERPAPILSDLLAAVEEQETENTMPDVLIQDEDDIIDTESIHSSVSENAEKENQTPKFLHDSANPFYVATTKSGSGSVSRPVSRPSGSGTKPSVAADGPSLSIGAITRSRRRALGSISPWRWNTFDEQMALATIATKGGKGLDLFDGSCSPSKGLSDWIESISPQKNKTESASSSSNRQTTGGRQLSIPQSASASSSSNSNSTPVATSSSSSSVSNKGNASASASTSASASASSSSSTSASTSATTSKLPDYHPNSSEHYERRGSGAGGPPSSLVVKLAESAIQPHSQAFNRRAQQLEGRIYYWKHGSCHLVSEHDKQQWPGEWKFDIFQDPESPDASPNPFSIENNHNSSASVSETHSGFGTTTTSTAATYKGKGKMTERQLGGPASKRMKMIREPLGGLYEQTGSPGPLQQQQQQQQPDPEPLHTGIGIGIEQDTTPPSSPSSRASAAAARRQEASPMEKQSRLQDRYDFRERRMLNGPLTSKSRRYGT
ncbi:hypothetical protein BGX31_001483, partial [Mortierella sp. GBA43]